MNGVNANTMKLDLKEKAAPKWILDRRDSGRLFWRRDSANILSENGAVVNRVKFRCDVEILEFLKNEEEVEEFSTSEEDDERAWGKRCWRIRSKEDMPPPSSLVGGMCIVVIIAVLTYQWWFTNSKNLT